MALDWFKKKSKKSAEGQNSAQAASKAMGSNYGRHKGAGISKLLAPELILVSPLGLNKDGLIEFLTRRLCEFRSLGDPAPFLAKVMEREQGISTTLDSGLAIPHARMDGLKNLSAIVGLAPKGFADPRHSDLMIRAMFLFFSPNRQDAFAQHLRLLRDASSLFSAAFIDEIAGKTSSEEIYQLIRLSEFTV